MIPFVLALLWLADVSGCDCNVAKPDTLEARQCSLCKAAEAQPKSAPFFFLKDASPTKPNRTLILPRGHDFEPRALAQMSAGDRSAWWAAAIAKGKELWGEDWAVAYNGDERRTQCHGHIHIGKISPEAQKDGFVIVSGPADIPVPANGGGVWLHAVAGKLCVHSGEQVTEFNLIR